MLWFWLQTVIRHLPSQVKRRVERTKCLSTTSRRFLKRRPLRYELRAALEAKWQIYGTILDDERKTMKLLLALS